MSLIRRLLDRLPHDTLHVGGEVYMRRWYVFGYAPTPDDPDARMICASCRGDVLLIGDRWDHRSDDGIVGEVRIVSEDTTGITISGELRPEPHDVVAISAARPGWWWTDHGLGMVRIHEIVASDDSRAFHDHPWPFLSILLRGSYVEQVPTETYYDENDRVIGASVPNVSDDVITGWFVPDDAVYSKWETEPFSRYRAPAINRKQATDLHVLTVERGPVWSLFLTRPKVRSWGFAGPFGWLPWRTFDKEFPERDAWVEP